MKIDITEKAKAYINQKSISTITFEKESVPVAEQGQW